MEPLTRKEKWETVKITGMLALNMAVVLFFATMIGMAILNYLGSRVAQP